MKPISALPLRDLVRGREEIVRRLEGREPTLMQELRLYDAAIAAYDKVSPDKPYAAIKWPKNAIPLCLARNQVWMTREQIQKDLEAGGFVFDPETFPQLLSDALRYHSRKGTIVRRDEEGTIIKAGAHKPHTRFRKEQFGLAEWAKSGKIKSLKEIS